MGGRVSGELCWVAMLILIKVVRQKARLMAVAKRPPKKCRLSGGCCRRAGRIRGVPTVMGGACGLYVMSGTMGRVSDLDGATGMRIGWVGIAVLGPCAPVGHSWATTQN